MNPAVVKPQRLFFLDLVRILAVFALTIFHSFEWVFDQPDVTFTMDESLIAFLTPLCRILSWSGFTVLSLSFFLVGLKDQKIPIRLWLYIAVGTILVILAGATNPTTSFVLEWDIYQFLLVSILTLIPISRSRACLLGSAGLGLFMMLIPWWQIPWFDTLPKFFRFMTVGICDGSALGDWPLLPWIGVVWISFACGRGVKVLQEINQGLETWRKWEWILWLVILAVAFPWLGTYYKVPLDNFSCFMFRQDLRAFWSYWAVLAFSIRLAFLSRFNTWLSEISLVRIISASHWNRHFGRCYMLHFLFLALGGFFPQQMAAEPRLYDLFALGLIPATEVLSRLLDPFLRKFSVRVAPRA